MYKTLIIGGSKGLGERISEKVWENNGTVRCLSRRTKPMLDLEWEGDVIIRRVREVIADMNGIDNLIVSAGAGAYLNPIGSGEDVEKMNRVNFLGPVYAFRAAYKALLKSKGKACFITSTCARRPGSGGLSVYGACKAGLNGYVINESRRAASRGIALFAVAPGWFQSEMTDELNPKVKAAAEKAIPFGRFGEMDEVAKFVASLMLQSNWCVAGQIFECSGGL
jgi:NAD(P)-dependent dehydrogenase (short-subunit alcohol dehydrogenase family)